MGGFDSASMPELAGAVEVLVEEHSGTKPNIHSQTVNHTPNPGVEIRQVTGCTSPKTTVTFLFNDLQGKNKAGLQISNIYVLDSLGSVLARADLPKARR